MAGRSTRSRCDGGFTLVETLIALVLLGTSVIAVVVGLRITIVGTTIERDHAKAYQWLQSANGVVQAMDRVSCEGGEAGVRDAYEERIRLHVVNPPGWDEEQLSVLAPVKAWNGHAYRSPGEDDPYCRDSDGFNLQLITLQVTSPDGRIIETLQVVKDG